MIDVILAGCWSLFLIAYFGYFWYYDYFLPKKFKRSLRIGDVLVYTSDLEKNRNHEHEFLPNLDNPLERWTILKIGKRNILVEGGRPHEQARKREIRLDVVSIFEVINNEKRKDS